MSIIQLMTFKDIIDRWPKPAMRTLSDDLGLPYISVNKWRKRDSIPPEYWIDLLKIARKRRISLSCKELAQTYRSRWRREWAEE